MIGERVGRYDVVEELGSGAMANVYKVKDIGTKAIYAMKILHPFLNESKTIVERFRRESKVIAALQHEHIVKFRDYVEEGETFAFVMELLEADTLEDILLDAERVPERFAISLIMQLCDALQYAHACSIIHRDIKPSNIFIVEGRGVVLTDFGLAKPLFGTALTMDGAKLMGTPFYMAPEQVTGEKTDSRTDVYQTGLLFYQLVTGRLPFADKSTFEAITARNKEQPSFLPQERLHISDEVIERILKATAISPADRYQSAEEMRESVKELHHSQRSN